MFGNTMPLQPSWADIAVRLLLTIVASALIGLNRQAGGHDAGFRTTVLVGVAACLSMIQANILLSVVGKTQQSFAVMDVLRFPLGVLTGVGFIGGGAILKRGDLVTGLTTAATMWVITAIGLCFGGGQLLVGCMVTALVYILLGPLKAIDTWIAQEQKAGVTLEAPAAFVPDLGTLLGAGVDVRFAGKRRVDADIALFSYEIRWRDRAGGSGGQPLLAALQEKYTVDKFEIAKIAD